MKKPILRFLFVLVGSAALAREPSFYKGSQLFSPAPKPDKSKQQ